MPYKDKVTQQVKSRERYLRKRSSILAYAKEYRERNRDKIVQSLRDRRKNDLDNIRENDRVRFLKKLYNLTVKEYQDILAAQGGVCGLCREPFSGSKSERMAPCVDHNHQTKVVRGIVHNRCNRLIGVARDQIVLLEQAIEYLKKDQAT